MRILKVAHIVEPYPAAGGIGASVGHTARWLASRGHHVTVVSLDHGLRAGGPPPVANLEFEYLTPAFHYRRIGTGRAVWDFARRRTGAFDIVHIYGFYDLVAPSVARIAHTRRIPVVLEPAGNLPPAHRSVLKKKAYIAALGRALLDQCSVVLAGSELEKRALQTMRLAAPVVVRAPAVDPPPAGLQERARDMRARVLSGDPKPVVVFLGRISRVKATDLLVRACSRLSPRVVLLLAGPDDGDGTLQRTLAIGRRLRVDVRWLGPVVGDSKWALLGAADVVALPSRSESFGLVAGEALAAGTPVLVSKRTGIAESLEGIACARIVDLTVANIAAGLADLLARSGSREPRKCACEIASLFHSDRPLCSLESLYEDLIAGRSAGRDPRAETAPAL